MNILVTGCGGDIGQSIGKILKEITFIKKVVGCDISNKTPSKFIYDVFLPSLPCNDESYLIDLISKIIDYRIDLIIPASEQEIRFFEVNNICSVNSIKLLLANKKAMFIGFDKYKTIEMLKTRNMPFPKTFLIEDALNVEIGRAHV